MKKTLYGLILALLALPCFGQVSAVRIRFSAGAVATNSGGGGGGGAAITNVMVAFWAMTNTGSASEPDLISGTNTLTVSAGDTIPLLAIVQGAGRDFETGDDDYMVGASNSIVDLGNDTSFSIVTWVNMESGSVFKQMLRKPGSFSVSISSANLLQFTINSAATNRVLVGQNIGIGTNYLLAFIHNATNDTQAMFVFEPDGVRTSSQSYTEGTTNTGSAFWVSAFDTDTTINWDGVIGMIGIWHRAVSSNELSGFWNNGSGVAWPFSGL